jgi:hypothetical protein
MVRRSLFLSAAALALSVFGIGCQTKEPVIYGEAHLKRHALTFVDGFSHPTPFNPVPFDHLHADVDRIFYGIEDYPGESYGDHISREGMSFVNGLHRFHMDMDRIIFDMPEYPLETEY